MADPPYPELKKTHSMARKGRPWRDFKPPPAGPVWGVIQGFNNYWMLVAAIDLGIFDTLESSGPAELSALAEQLQASPMHLRHLLDAMVSLGFLEQLNDRYELTEMAERYLCRSGAASMAELVRVSPGPLENWQRLAETIRHGGVATPIENDPGGFYGPLVQATYATQHRAAGRLGARLGWARRGPLRVLDLGAGMAPWAISALGQAPGSTAVVNELPAVIGLAEAKVAECGLADRVAFRPGDFHSIEIEPDAYDLVFLCHICRTEGPDLTPRLIERATAGLRPGGTLVIADYFADNERKLNAFGVQMGMTMLANTERGRLITHEMMQRWLAAQPLEMIRLIEPIGFQFVYVASKKPQKESVR